MADKKEEKKPKIDFKKISKELNDINDKAKVDQIGPSITDAYIQFAKYTDDKGVTHYKTKFKPKEAEELGNKVYDALIYHAHRRYFNMDEKKYQDLLKIKDKFGNPYVDVVAQYHFQIDREGLTESLKEMAENDGEISHGVLEEILKKPMKNHVQMIQGKITKDIRPEHIDDLKSHIKGIVKKHNLPKKMVPDVDKIYDMGHLLGTYINLAQQYNDEDKVTQADFTPKNKRKAA